ncbi:MAG TPA: polysaccharide deacetylase [Solirubrobacteraceae bacterium]|nr:polysaccharide deacetylase [Solirubrobacteraceae bacterium]
MSEAPAGWRGAAAAVAVLTFDVDAESPILAEGRRYADHAMVMTHQAFGPRVGVPRLLALLAEYGLPATFFVPGLTAERYPGTVAAILEAGHEVGHHSYGHRSAVTLSADGERADFERALVALERVGVTPRGHRAALWEASWRTPALVAEHGLVYDSSLMDADTPYVLETDRGEIVELPPHWSLDDWEQYAYLPQPRIGTLIRSPVTVAEMWIHELESMCRHGSLFMLTCHPFLSGRAGRVEALRRVIEAGLERGDVEFCGCLQLAERALADPGAERRLLEPVVVPPDTYPDV